MFIRTLVHESVLISENLERRGIEGSFCCPLCNRSKETIHHLFLNCSFARKVWELLVCLWVGNIDLPGNIHQDFLSWDKMYQGNFDNNKKGLKTYWLTLPKFIFWFIWNERNQRIFKDKAHYP